MSDINAILNGIWDNISDNQGAVPAIQENPVQSLLPLLPIAKSGKMEKATEKDNQNQDVIAAVVDVVDVAYKNQAVRVNTIENHVYDKPDALAAFNRFLSGAAIPVVRFEQEGDPVSCRYWQRVCWAVGKYQAQCTRDERCPVFKFLADNRSDD